VRDVQRGIGSSFRIRLRDMRNAETGKPPRRIYITDLVSRFQTDYSNENSEGSGSKENETGKFVVKVSPGVASRL